MKKYLCIVLCLVLNIVFSSCGLTSNNVSSEASVNSVVDDGDPFTFEKVDELKAAIKKQPSQYEDKQITVKGGILTKTLSNQDDYIALSVYHGGGGDNSHATLDRYYARQKPYIKIVMSEEVKHSLLEEGDYVKIIGTVKITDDEIYLDNCTYEMIETVYE